MDLAATAIDVSCNGAANGTINLTVSGGTPAIPMPGRAAP
ncbi:MAG: SprB repeat-containing protein [Lewinellaceae bacterium]|nr:SprB repeat-containing protein [Lewinellaceae bacterium]